MAKGSNEAEAAQRDRESQRDVGRSPSPWRLAGVSAGKSQQPVQLANFAVKVAYRRDNIAFKDISNTKPKEKLQHPPSHKPLIYNGILPACELC